MRCTLPSSHVQKPYGSSVLHWDNLEVLITLRMSSDFVGIQQNSTVSNASFRNHASLSHIFPAEGKVAGMFDVSSMPAVVMEYRVT